ncbi:BZ3500_MvSof-1268-A1-R1_Chr5-2g07871 [Microbotryum saponariae]|uniref:BZ3500_MvSof-1268-A1-R1_Chr5-2g07867 protein n=1 Tax=Microbotryum saponariae TaxID=289078 RepID=A0A2X0KGR8_9BASI|nr:BZ3500_MvSof-1268-A1-R1_Chr5-2g07867 [Microbotryum saponariae]SCZ92453.1 BZ3500_MvSof-1268-A1-R1_Chr5-2g07871 [Microbotryum saponariae]SDA05736.1 BZ3501_MvSof-1269-A2-R1_Chr5-2g07689 [Microbotryum saponariae]SDA05740.1 BZ3501_MvSof-1269-A2-R1_Chr5-2g07693 [Microbotryum saponariae]
MMANEPVLTCHLPAVLIWWSKMGKKMGVAHDVATCTIDLTAETAASRTDVTLSANVSLTICCISFSKKKGSTALPTPCSTRIDKSSHAPSRATAFFLSLSPFSIASARPNRTNACGPSILTRSTSSVAAFSRAARSGEDRTVWMSTWTSSPVATWWPSALTAAASILIGVETAGDSFLDMTAVGIRVGGSVRLGRWLPRLRDPGSGDEIELKSSVPQRVSGRRVVRVRV